MILRFAFLVIFFVTPVNAQEAHEWYGGESSRVQGGLTPSSRPESRRYATPVKQRGRRSRATRTYAGSGSILPHPAGCPRRAFCGCGASVKVFGRSVRSLWTARSWLKFPRTAAAPGMVAANRRHVMVIEQVLPGNKAVVYDANSGRGMTRRHVRSLAGFTVVNPRASRVAGLR